MVRTKKKDNKKDFFTVVMIVQTLLGSILIVAMLVSFRGSGRFLSVMTEAYLEYMQTDFTADDISDVINKIRGVVKTVDNNDDAQTVKESESEVPAIGGKDLEFSSLEALEGISFEDIETDVDMTYPLRDYRITSEFGYRTGPITGEAGVHTGLDMAADYGTAIFAAADGEVLDADWDNSYGKYVKILHKNNTVSIYAHCSRLCVDEGENVKQGEKIAEVGSTGASTGNHLHFEVRKDNIRINPYFLLNEKEQN